MKYYLYVTKSEDLFSRVYVKFCYFLYIWFCAGVKKHFDFFNCVTKKSTVFCSHLDHFSAHLNPFCDGVKKQFDFFIV
jgi:hypothetical protein